MYLSYAYLCPHAIIAIIFVPYTYGRRSNACYFYWCQIFTHLSERREQYFIVYVLVCSTSPCKPLAVACSPCLGAAVGVMVCYQRA